PWPGTAGRAGPGPGRRGAGSPGVAPGPPAGALDPPGGAPRRECALAAAAEDDHPGLGRESVERRRDRVVDGRANRVDGRVVEPDRLDRGVRHGRETNAVQTARLETFADGVFAIAATLLIIDVTADAPGAALGAELRHAWPQYAAYAVSFLTIGIMWVNHHACMQLIERADRSFLFINIALLACIAFVPFPTRLVAQHLRDDGLRAAAL